VERLYELGKRFERLLYMSIVVIIVNLLTSSLLITLSSQNSFILLSSYKNIKQQIENKRDEIESLTRDIKAVNENISYILKLHEESAKLGIVITGEDKAKVENDYFSIRKKSINETREILGLSAISSINDASDFIYKLLESEINKSSIRYLIKMDILSELPEKKELVDYSDMIFWLDKKIKSESEAKIEIVNIESTLNIPFKIGDMTSSVSLLSIAAITSHVMPIFMVIWLGSLIITRRFEIINLIKTKDISMAYPHVFNLFNVETTKSDTLERYLLGDKDAKKQMTDAVGVMNFVKAISFIFFALAMCAPLYYGESIYSFSNSSSSTLQFMIFFICLLINIVQIMYFVYSEWISSNIVYRIRNGVVSEYTIDKSI